MVDLILPCPKARQAKAHAQFFRNRRLRAETDQFQIIRLGMECAQPASGQGGLQVRKEDRSLPYRKDPRLGTRTKVHMGAVPDGEEGVVTDAAQGPVNPDKSVLQAQARLFQPRGGQGSGHRRKEGGLDGLAIGQMGAVSLDPIHLRAGTQIDIQCFKFPRQGAAQAQRGEGQDLVGGLNHSDLCAGRQAREAMVHGHGQFDPAHTASDDGGGRWMCPRLDPLNMRAPSLRKA